LKPYNIFLPDVAGLHDAQNDGDDGGDGSWELEATRSGPKLALMS
jgi:hypothetical protein